MAATPWLLLLYSLPTKRNTARVAVWRRLKRFGAAPLTTSTYLLPDSAPQYEQFQWLPKQIRDSGGDATLVRAQEIEGLARAKIVSIFNSARDADDAGLKKALQALAKSKSAETSSELERLTKQFRELRAIDFFDSARGHEVAMLLQRAEQNPRKPAARLQAKNFRGRTWQTRPRPEIDRVGSAWLIRKFIDPEAKFVFESSPPPHGDIIPFAMLDVEFTHAGDRCTFETLVRRFGIEDKTVRKIGEMIHDADLDDAKFQRVECVGY